ncbi:MAG TPA: MBL fold metallo-hydrolase [Opitutaceae bacterium]|nr:MBL fold metallo-hydrolase [Opitutaceae bacterium]
MKLSSSFLVASVLSVVGFSAAHGQIGAVQEVAPGVFFHQGDPRRGHCNNGWILFEDYLLLVDANFPSGAEVVMPKIKETSGKPVRFAFNTHHHSDHSYGNQLWVDAGAVPVAHVGVLEEMKRTETGYFGGAPGGWEASAKNRPDVAATRLKPPTLLFPKELFVDDGKQRVELRWFGVAHTRGDAMAWLPQQKILFTGDVCVNGPHNAVHDANISEWIKTLEALKSLGAEKVCPGHGPMGGPEIIVDQQGYFIALQREVKALLTAGKSAAEVKAALPELATKLKATANIARYVPGNLTAHVRRVWMELGGGPFP